MNRKILLNSKSQLRPSIFCLCKIYIIYISCRVGDYFLSLLLNVNDSLFNKRLFMRRDNEYSRLRSTDKSK